MRRHRFTILLALAALGSSVGPIHAAVVDEIAPFVQPDGSTFTVRVYRDEFGLFMATTEGYVIQNPTDEAYYYARYDEEGNAAPTAMKVGGDHSVTDLAILEEANYAALAEMARRLHEGTERSSGQGTASGSGMFFYRLATETLQSTRTMALVK